MKFFYWADKDSPLLTPIKNSASFNGINVTPISFGQIKKNWHNSLFKQHALYRAVRELKDDTIVCATDGFDVFYQQDSEYIKNQFLALKKDVVFSAEKGFSHQYLKYKSYFDSQQHASPYKYLNAGSVIGYAGALRILYKPGTLIRLKVALVRFFLIKQIHRMLKRIARRTIPSYQDRRNKEGTNFPWYRYTDQAMMAKQLACGLPGLSIDLDRECKLFGCTAFEWEDIDLHYQLLDGKWRNTHTESVPACIHVPYPIYLESVFMKLYESVYEGETERKFDG